MPQKKNEFETFSDGILEICTTDERRLIGTKVKGIRFGDRTICLLYTSRGSSL